MAILQQYADILLRGRTSAGYTYLSGLARFDIAAGTSSLAPLRVATGVLVSSTVSGAIENDGANLYWTDSNGVRSPLLNGSNYAQYGLSVLQAGRLATGRYIGIGGGVVAEASLFSGEGDLVLQVSSVHADYLTGMVPIDVLPVGSGSGQVAAGDHTHLYAGSASVGGPAASALVCTGNAVTATTLATGRALKIGEKSNNFDGSSDLEWTLVDIGASAAGHTHPYLPLSGGTLTGKLTLGTGGSIYKADWDSNVIPYFVSGEMVVNPDVTISSFAPMSHASSDTSYGVSGVGVYGHAQASATVPKANSGVGSVGIETSSFARGDHYHPVVCSVLQAGRLATGRYIGIGGGVVAEASLFSGEGDLVLQVSSVHADYLTGMVPIDVLPVGTGSTQVASGDHTHDSVYLKLSGGTLTGQLSIGTGGVIYKSGWENNVIPYFVSGEMVTNSGITLSSFAMASHSHLIGDLPKLSAGSLLVGAGTSTAMLELSKGSAGQVLSVNSSGLTPYLEWSTPQWKNGSGTGAIQSKISTSADGNGSIAFGEGTVANGANQTVLGKYNVANTTDVLQIGWGTSSVPANILSISSIGTVAVVGLITTDTGLQINVGDVDQYLIFNHTGGTGYSWRFGYIGTGTGDSNYLVIESSGSDGTWTRAVQYGLLTLDATHYGNILPASGVSKSLGSSGQKWSSVYATTLYGNTSGATGTFTGDVSAANYTGAYKVNNYGGTWIHGKTVTDCVLGNVQQTQSSYHVMMRVTSASGNVWNIGGLNDAIGFYGYYAARTENGTDWATVWDTNTGALTHNKALTVSGATTLSSTLSVSSTVTLSSLSTVGIVHNSAAGVLSTGKVALASEVSGTLGVGNGGTGRATLTANSLLYGDGTSSIGMLAIGGANTFLKSTGSGYEWVSIRKNDSSEIATLSTTKASPTAITYVSGDNKVYHLQCTAPSADQVFFVNLPDLANVVSGDKLEFTLTKTSGNYDAQVVFNPNTSTAIFRLGSTTITGTTERIRIGTGEAIVFYALYSGQAGLSWRVMRYVDMEV